MSRIPFDQNRITRMSILPAVRLIYVGELYIFQKGGHGDYLILVNPVRITFDNVPWLQGRWQGKHLRNMSYIHQRKQADWEIHVSRFFVLLKTGIAWKYKTACLISTDKLLGCRSSLDSESPRVPSISRYGVCVQGHLCSFVCLLKNINFHNSNYAARN